MTRAASHAERVGAALGLSDRGQFIAPTRGYQYFVKTTTAIAGSGGTGQASLQTDADADFYCQRILGAAVLSAASGGAVIYAPFFAGTHPTIAEYTMASAWGVEVQIANQDYRWSNRHVPLPVLTDPAWLPTERYVKAGDTLNFDIVNFTATACLVYLVFDGFKAPKR